MARQTVIELHCLSTDLVDNRAEKEIFAMTLREQLIKNISALPEAILYEVYEYALFKTNRIGHSKFRGQNFDAPLDLVAEQTSDFDASEAATAFEFLKKYKGSITREIDCKKEKLEYLDERYGVH
jgi:hypothetical protein